MINKSKVNKDKGIIWSNNDTIKIPKLILPKEKINNNNLYTERKKNLSQSQKIINNENKKYSTQRMWQLFMDNEEKEKVGKVLKIKKDNINLVNNKIEYTKKNLLKKLGLNKSIEDRVTRKVLLGALEKENNKKNKNKKNMHYSKSNKYENNIRLKCLDKGINILELNDRIIKSSSFIINNNIFNDKDIKKDNNCNKILKINKKKKFMSLNNKIKKWI